MGSLAISDAQHVLSALLPLLKLSRQLRDTAILVLRKALFARHTTAKQAGLYGVLLLLKAFHIASTSASTAALTQFSQSSASMGLSQVASSIQRGRRSATNELLCSDLLGVLRRALTQKAPVKMTLYAGLPDVVARNPELCRPVLDILYRHALKNRWIRAREETDDGGTGEIINVDAFVKVEEGVISITVRKSNRIDRRRRGVCQVWAFSNMACLDWGRIPIALKSRPCCSQDPIGWYFHCVQQILFRAEVLFRGDSEDEDDADVDRTAERKLSALLEDVSAQLAGADLLDLNFDKEATYNRNTADGIRNVLRAEQARK